MWCLPEGDWLSTPCSPSAGPRFKWTFVPAPADGFALREAGFSVERPGKQGVVASVLSAPLALKPEGASVGRPVREFARANTAGPRRQQNTVATDGDDY